ncbi:MAG: hypothetical protein ACM3RP_03240 [Chitinophagales bacterium]
MKDQTRSDALDNLLRSALADEPYGQPSARVMAAVMRQVRQDAAARQAQSAQRSHLLAALVAAGLMFAWMAVQLGLSLWPGLTGFLRVPAVEVAFGLVWWVVKKAVATLLLLAAYGLGNLLPLLLLGGLAVVPLALRHTGPTAS